MNELNGHGETINHIGVFLLSVMFGVLGWLANHNMMRHGLFAAAAWGGCVSLMRVMTSLGWLQMADARLINGWFAWLTLSMLGAAWLAAGIVEKRKH